jgi:superfamily II DNA/RNA helicase
LCIWQDIENLKYQVIVTNIEIFEEMDGPFEKLWKQDLFTSKVISIIWDEGHCVSRWADFRPEYKNAGRLRYIIPSHIPFYVTSATLPPIVLDDVMSILHMQKSNTYILERSNDRHNISICVRELQHPANSYLDLAFLIPENLPPGWKPPKFLIFFDDIAESIAVANFLRQRLPPEYRDMIKWFNSNMSAQFRDVEAAKLKAGDTWGLCCTDSFGMVRKIIHFYKLTNLIGAKGMDLPNITLIIQWKATYDLCTLWQRFGRAVRDLKLEGKALLLVESKYFDKTKEARANAAQEKKRKAAEGVVGNRRPLKRARTEKGAQTTNPVSQGLASASRAPCATLPEAEVDRSLAGEKERSEGVPAVNENTAAAGPDMALFEASRWVAYAEVPKTERKRTKRKVEDIEPALDDMINAESRPEIRCFRLPAIVYFAQRKNSSLSSMFPRCLLQCSHIYVH